MSIEKRDLESGPPTPEGNIQSDVEAGQTIVLSADRVHKLQARWAVLRYLNAFESWLDRKLGVETQGVDRIPEEEKRPPSVWNIFLMWWSLNIHVGVLPLGLLGPEFGLSLKQSIAASIIGIILGALMTATTGTLGPKVRKHRSGSCTPKMALIKAARHETNRHITILFWLLGRQTV